MTLKELAEETPEQRAQREQREQWAWDFVKRGIKCEADIIKNICEFVPKNKFDEQFAEPYFQIRSIRHSLREIKLALRINKLAEVGIVSPMVTPEEVNSEYDHKFDSAVMESLNNDLLELIFRAEIAISEADISREEQKEIYQLFRPLRKILNKLTCKGLEMWRKEQAQAALERTPELPFQN